MHALNTDRKAHYMVGLNRNILLHRGIAFYLWPGKSWHNFKGKLILNQPLSLYFFLPGMFIGDLVLNRRQRRFRHFTISQIDIISQKKKRAAEFQRLQDDTISLITEWLLSLWLRASDNSVKLQSGETNGLWCGWELKVESKSDFNIKHNSALHARQVKAITDDSKREQKAFAVKEKQNPTLHANSEQDFSTTRVCFSSKCCYF